MPHVHIRLYTIIGTLDRQHIGTKTFESNPARDCSFNSDVEREQCTRGAFRKLEKTKLHNSRLTPFSLLFPYYTCPIRFFTRCITPYKHLQEAKFDKLFHITMTETALNDFQV